MTLQKHLIVLVGPTAVGKTELGIQLANHFDTEIISADSRQLYREMHIGTAAPTNDELARATHHFIKNKSVADYYNASMFEVDALNLLTRLFDKYDVILMVGGSTLYVDTACHGIDDLPTVDADLRNSLMKRYQEEGIEFLQQQLLQLDPEHYQKVDRKNPNRMLKAIEVSLMTGKPYSGALTAPRKQRPFNIIKVGVNRDRAELYNRINQRVDQMLEAGLVAEVQSLQYARHTNALRTVGYREIFEYLDGNISLDLATEQIKTNTRRYAKRQITWFARDKSMPWFNPENKQEIIDYIGSKMRMCQ